MKRETASAFKPRTIGQPKAPSPQHDAVFRWMLNGADSLGDPNDRGMLDVVGFDTSVPAVIANFVRE